MSSASILYGVFASILISGNWPPVEAKCTNTFLTWCERISDVGRFGDVGWNNLVVGNDPCKRESAKKDPDHKLSKRDFGEVLRIEQLTIAEKVKSKKKISSK